MCICVALPVLLQARAAPITHLLCVLSLLGSLLASLRCSAPPRPFPSRRQMKSQRHRHTQKAKQLPCEDEWGTLEWRATVSCAAARHSPSLTVCIQFCLSACVRLSLITAAPRRPAPTAIVAAAAVALAIAMTVAAVAAAVARAVAPAAATAAAAAASADDDRRRRADGTRRPSRPLPA